jgi:heat shock protein HslJ
VISPGGKPIWHYLRAGALVALLVGGCSTAQTGKEIIGEWSLELWEHQGESVQPIPTGVSLSIAGDKASGFSGCNTYGFSFELLAEQGLSITSGIATTKRVCPEESTMKFESEFISSLSSAPTIKQEGEKLVLVTNGTVLQFFRSGSPSN